MDTRPRRVAMDENRPPLLCARCGDRIGVYEPVWLELADGALRSSSYLNLDRYAPYERSRLWHLGCLAPDGVPPTTET